MPALLLSYPSSFTDITYGRKFFGQPNGSKSKPQQSTLAFKETNKAENTKDSGQNGVRQVRKQNLKEESQDSDLDQGALSSEEPDSSAPTRGDNETSKKPDIVSEGLSNGECG